MKTLPKLLTTYLVEAIDVLDILPHNDAGIKAKVFSGQASDAIFGKIL